MDIITRQQVLKQRPWAENAIRLYVDQKLTTTEVGKLVGKSGKSVSTMLRAVGLIRSKSEARTLSALGELHGRRFGRLVVAAVLGPSPSTRKTLARCACDCGGEVVVPASALKSGTTKSCGCLQKELAAARYTLDLSGQAFGRLTVHSRAEHKRGRVAWNCVCACGSKIVVAAADLARGDTTSCGCLTRGEDSIDAWLGERFRNPSAEAVLYVFPLARFAGYAKVGIATDMGKRKSGSGGEYGDVHDYIAMPRLDAWLVEQALLHATKYIAGCPAELADAKWGGYTEVRRMSPPAAFKLALDLYDQLQELGRSEFAIRYVPMTPAKQRAVAKLVA